MKFYMSYVTVVHHNSHHRRILQPVYCYKLSDNFLLLKGMEIAFDKILLLLLLLLIWFSRQGPLPSRNYITTYQKKKSRNYITLAVSVIRTSLLPRLWESRNEQSILKMPSSCDAVNCNVNQSASEIIVSDCVIYGS